MSLSKLFANIQLSQADAEVIFDRDEPVGEPTDLVMPRRRWFRKSATRSDAAKTQNSAASSADRDRSPRVLSSLSAADQQS